MKRTSVVNNLLFLRILYTVDIHILYCDLLEEAYHLALV